MKQSSNLGLALYERTDLMNITGSTNSLNHNMELIDLEIDNLKRDLIELQNALIGVSDLIGGDA